MKPAQTTSWYYDENIDIDNDDYDEEGSVESDNQSNWNDIT